MTTPNELPTDLIDATRAAQIIDVHLATIHRWIKKGHLRGWRRGGRYLVSEAEVHRQIKPVEVKESEDGYRTPAERQRGHERAMEELRRMGYKV